MKVKVFFLTLTYFFAYQIAGYSQDFQDDFFTRDKQVIRSQILDQERILFIYLPNDYFKDTTQSYPVHYVLDAPGQSNLYFELLRMHGLMNYVPQGIVVGLSANDRNYLLSPDQGAEKCFQFINKEVIPFIEQTYRTKPFRVLAGHSLGGDFVFYSFLKEPTLFNAYIAGSPGPLTQIMPLIMDHDFDANDSPYTFFFSSVGSKDLTDTASFRQLERKFMEGDNAHLDSHFSIYPGENHISNIAINFQRALGSLYRDWQFQLPDNLQKPVSELIKAHYDFLEKKFGYRPEVSQWEVIYPVMDKLARRGDFANAIDILKYCVTLYPNSDQAYAFLAKAHFDTGKIKLGKRYLERSLELNPDNQMAKQIQAMMEKS